MCSGKNKLFTDYGCISPHGFEMLKSKSLSKADKQAIFGHIKNCELCKDAWEGLHIIDNETCRSQLFSIQKKILLRSVRESKRRGIKLRHQKGKVSGTILGLVIGSVFILVFYYLLIFYPKNVNKNIKIYSMSNIHKVPIPTYSLTDSINKKYKSELVALEDTLSIKVLLNEKGYIFPVRDFLISKKERSIVLGILSDYPIWIPAKFNEKNVAIRMEIKIWNNDSKYFYRLH